MRAAGRVWRLCLQWSGRTTTQSGSAMRELAAEVPAPVHQGGLCLLHKSSTWPQVVADTPPITFTASGLTHEAEGDDRPSPSRSRSPRGREGVPDGVVGRLRRSASGSRVNLRSGFGPRDWVFVGGGSGSSPNRLPSVRQAALSPVRPAACTSRTLNVVCICEGCPGIAGRLLEEI